MHIDVHEMSKPVSGEDKKSISLGRLLKILPSMPRVSDYAHILVYSLKQHSYMYHRIGPLK